MSSARGRRPGFVMSDEHRVKIQNSNILNALIEHALGQREMTQTQVNAGINLLKKVLPDLSAMTIDGGLDNTTRVISERPVTPDEWAEEHADMGTPAGTASSIN